MLANRTEAKPVSGFIFVLGGITRATGKKDTKQKQFVQFFFMLRSEPH
jgi:hypothetical protein